MDYKKILIALGVVAVAIPLLKTLYDRAQAPSAGQSANGTSPQVKKMVEQTLSEHKGEASPFVQAFEDALEQEAHRDKSLGRSPGLPA